MYVLYNIYGHTSVGILNAHLFQRGWVDFERATCDTCLMCVDRYRIIITNALYEFN